MMEVDILRSFFRKAFRVLKINLFDWYNVIIDVFAATATAYLGIIISTVEKMLAKGLDPIILIYFFVVFCIPWTVNY